MTGSIRREGRLILATVVAGLFAVPVGGQTLTSISGVVTDSAGAPIASARVEAQGIAAPVLTDFAGRFRLAGVTPGTVSLSVRRLGFVPRSLTVPVADGGAEGVAIRLAPLASVLSPVVVKTGRRVEYAGRLAGYYDRLSRRGGGQFITREQIDRENPRLLTHLLHRVPGITLTRLRGGRTGIRMRGRNCWPLVWIDGISTPSGELDLDAVPPSSLHGIEIYLGSTTAPLKYSATRDQSSCGTILLWSRGPDTDPVYRVPDTAALLERMLASEQIFAADRVDKTAQPDPARAVPVEYPPQLLASRMPGVVVAEFVVTPQGQVQSGTFGIISSPHPLFSEAVRKATATAWFTPAQRQGRAVGQLVQQPFVFIP